MLDCKVVSCEFFEGAMILKGKQKYLVGAFSSLKTSGQGRISPIVG